MKVRNLEDMGRCFRSAWEEETPRPNSRPCIHFRRRRTAAGQAARSDRPNSSRYLVRDRDAEEGSLLVQRTRRRSPRARSAQASRCDSPKETERKVDSTMAVATHPPNEGHLAVRKASPRRHARCSGTLAWRSEANARSLPSPEAPRRWPSPERRRSPILPDRQVPETAAACHEGPRGHESGLPNARATSWAGVHDHRASAVQGTGRTHTHTHTIAAPDRVFIA